MTPTAEDKTTRSLLWEVALLSLLREEPMHPYEMQRLMIARAKDEVLVLKRGSLYHAIRRLLAAELIEEQGTERQGRRPERTVYQITRAGEAALQRWLRQMIREPRREPSEFMGAISFLVYLTPEQARSHLEARTGALTAECAQLETRLQELMPHAGRINLIESEYLLAMRRAELVFVEGLVEQIRRGRLHWDLQAILRAVRAARKASERRS
jgi:DNA-binding PadR family transcriptional regulator